MSSSLARTSAVAVSARAQEAPYVHARWDGMRTVLAGLPHCELGHRLTGGDGVYCTWDWDGKELSARTDRFGCYPVYYFVRGGDVALSPSIPRLLRLGAPSTLDVPALALFLRLGYFVGEDTPFEAIRALPPGARFRWTEGRLEVSGGYVIPPPQRMAREAAADCYAVLFRAAVERRLPPGPFALPLSGGRDSRHMLLELDRMGCRPAFCVTVLHYPPRDNQDAQIAREVAAWARVPHVVLGQAERRFAAEVRKIWATSFCADEHAQFLALADFLAGRVRTSYDGIGGGVLSGYIPGLRRPERQAEELLYGNEEEIARLLVPSMYRRMSRAVALDRLAAELRLHEAAAYPVSSFWFWTRTRREVALVPYGIMSGIPTVYSPFLDHALYDFLASLDSSVRDQRLHEDVLRRAFPHSPPIPFEGPPRWRRSRRQSAQFRWDFTGHVLRHRPGRLTRPSWLSRPVLDVLVHRGGFDLTALYLFELERLVEGDLA